MSYSITIRNKALRMRSGGYSFNEISIQLKLPKGTIYEWTKEVALDANARKRINQRRLEGIQNSKLWWKARKDTWNLAAQRRAEMLLSKIEINSDKARLLAACLYWAEGSKSLSSLIFMNSDPIMVRTFLTLLRKGYALNEMKFRVLLHLHDYHNEAEMIKFWSLMTRIPRSQFNQVYHKPHTGRRKHENYLGSCSIRYYDASIARELTTIYKHLGEMLLILHT